MSFKDKTLLSVVKCFQHVLFWRVRSTLLNQKIEDLGIDSSKPVFYMTRYRSLTDALVLDHECTKANLPAPFASFEHTLEQQNVKFWNLCIPITRPGITQTSSKSPRFFSEKLRKLVETSLNDPTFDVQLVPASVFWGRSPRNEGSFWQAVFSDSWSIPGFFRKFLIVITKGRQTYVQLSEPFSLRQILEKEKESQRALAKTHRLIRRRMRMQREAFIGPDLSHRRTLLLSILETNEVKAKIARQATIENISVEKIQRRAFDYANEIAADYSHVVIRALHGLLKWLWTTLYKGIEVNGGPELQQLAQEHAIVYVPSHRSHIDYLLLSYVLYDNLDLVPPHIAAGVNLNLPVLGPILRRGGAFFMRRSFKENPLYAAIFSEYLHRVLDRGFSIEYFIEGGRSRTGRQLPPRPGMISMTLKSYSSRGNKPLVFVPVNFGYERLFEGKSYLGELRGKKKSKESLSQFIKSLRRIRENFGRVHVTFGEPISANEYLKDHDVSSSNQFNQLTYPEQKALAFGLGELISQRINAAASLHAIALLSLILQSTSKHAIEEELLISQLELLKLYFKTMPYSEHATLTELEPKAIIQYALDMGYIYRYPNQFGDILFASEKQAQFLSYFRNNVLHFFAVPSLICLLYCNRRDIPEDVLLSQATELYSFLQTELFLQWKKAELGAKLQRSIEFLHQNKVIYQVDNPRHLELLAGIIRPSLERFAIVLTLLEKSGSDTLTPRELESQARVHAERVSRLYQIHSPEYFDSKLFNNLVQQLFNNNLVNTNKEGKLEFGDELHAAARRTEIILGTNFHRYLWTQNS